VKTIVDTGPLVAMMNRSDRYHDWSVGALEHLQSPLWTCEPVLTEAAHLTGQGRALLDMVSSGFLRIGLEIEDQADGIESLLARYGKRMDLADACVVRMSELTRQCRVFTLDRRDFSVYRRNGRNVIPLLAPDA
jgi:predicted nucleic acid-binding protein